MTEIFEIVNGFEARQKLLPFVAEPVVRRAHIGPQRIATSFRNLDATKDRPHRRIETKCLVSVPLVGCENWITLMIIQEQYFWQVFEMRGKRMHGKISECAT